MSTFEEKLRKYKSNIKQSSQETYIRNIKRLRKVHDTLPIPAKDSSWVKKKKLLDWFDNQPLNVRRHLSNAAVITLQVLGDKNNSEWKKRQTRSMEQFDAERKTRKLNDKQKKLVPEKGFDAIKKAVQIMKKSLGHIKKIDSLKKLSRFQDLVILSLYYEFPLRLDYATLQIGDKTKTNRIFKNTKKPRGWHIVLTDFKTIKSLGEKNFKLGPANQRLLNKFIPAVQSLTSHGFLLSNIQGNKMTKQVLSKRLMQITRKKIGKSFSVQLLRILYAMRNRDVIESAKDVSDRLLHSQKQSLQYAKVD